MNYQQALIRQIAERHTPRIVGSVLTDALDETLSPDLDEFTRARIRRDVLRRLKPHLRPAIDRAVGQVVGALEVDER